MPNVDLHTNTKLSLEEFILYLWNREIQNNTFNFILYTFGEYLQKKALKKVLFSYHIR